MKKLGIYIFMILCLLTACQGPEIDETLDIPGDEIAVGEVTLTFGVNFIGGSPDTKAMGELPAIDIKTLHLVIFDENGYYIETREAEFVTSGINPLSNNQYKVTLNLTDRRRIIHFIANCPLTQLRYGHENDIISNLYVSKAEKQGDIETAYWHRVEVPRIVVNDSGNVLPEIMTYFQNVPLLRNYSQITVVDNDETDNFVLESFAVYNTISKGTVAPYNKNLLTFQSFFNKAEGELYSYDQLLSDRFEGHALAKVQLDTNLVESDFLAPGEPFYMYERKISVHTGGLEIQWDESPTHIILKGRYGDHTDPSYYKVDLIREVNSVNQYYNILRNFEYKFMLKSVTGPGYKTLADAKKNAAGNNLSGSTETRDLVDVSDGNGRIIVSYTDTTLTSSSDIKLKFKYYPDVNYATLDNEKVSVSGVLDGNGSVLKGLKGNINYNGADGWAEVRFRVQELPEISQKQEIILVTEDNSNLHKTIVFNLVAPYTMDLICYDPTTAGYSDNVIDEGIEQKVGLRLRIPNDLTENLFPLSFYIEADKLSIGPDVEKNQEVGISLPVETAPSIIPGKNSASFHYVYNIPSYSAYKNLTDEGNQKVIYTRWYTNLIQSASHVVVYNKYFNTASSYFKNSPDQTESGIIGRNMIFNDLAINPSPLFYGNGQEVNVSFNLDAREVNFLPKTVRIALDGLACAEHDHDEFDLYLYDGLSSLPEFSNHTMVVPMPKGSRTVVLKDLRTLANENGEGPVSFTINSAGYSEATSLQTQRIKPQFTMLAINPDPVLEGAGRDVSISFNMDANDERYASRDVLVKVNGLKKKGTENTNEFIVRPATSSSKVTIGDLETIDADSNISFTVTTTDDSYDVESGKSEIVTRRKAIFSAHKISPNSVKVGSTGQAMSISFRMDEDDETIGSTPVTVNLTGMKRSSDNSVSFTVMPDERYFTIDNLVLTANKAEEEIYFTLTASGYDPNTGKSLVLNPYVPTFNNLRFVQDGERIESIKADEVVYFNFDMNHYEEDMEVELTLDGLEPYEMPTEGPGSISPASTRAARTYIYKPTGSNCSITLRTLEDPTDGKYAVTLSADGFTGDSAEVEQKSLVVYKGDISGLTSTVDIGQYRNNISFSDSSISVGGGYAISYDEITISYNYSGRNLTVNIDISNLEISAESIDENTEVTIKFIVNYTDFRGNTNSKNVEVKKKIRDLKSLGLEKQN